ncbi:MAG: hypothetical protein Q4B31_03385 [Clostridia bacterium]|nr:hypothetical protein [Clostridia bacterium]
MLKILIGFDYELFLGENFAGHREILIDTTNQILEMLKKNNVSATLFADVCSALQYKKYGQTDFVDDFEKQIVWAENNNFDVQLHVHSNWLNSAFDGEKWDISPEGYRIHDFGFGKDGAGKIIKDGVDYLNNLLLPEVPDYKCIAYRAGGYSIQPHSDIVKVLRENGIYIDSSVCRHKYVDSNANKYDFRNLPYAINWWLTPDKDFTYQGTPSEGGLFEVPLLSDRNSLFKRFIKGKEKLNLPYVKPKGSYVKLDIPEEKKKTKIDVILNYNKTYELVSFDSMASERMYSVMEKIYKKYNAKKNDIYISIIGHPKLSNEYVLGGMEKFVKRINSDKDRFEFITFRQLYDELCEKNEIQTEV